MPSPNPMLQMVSNWFRRNFSNPEALGLFFTLLIGFLLLEFFAGLLMPVLVSIVIAYLLNSIVTSLQRCRLPHLLAVIIVYIVFLGLFLLALFGLLPLLWKQLSNLVNELPAAMNQSQTWIATLMHKFPRLFAGDPLQHIAVFLKQQSTKIGQLALSYSLASITSLISLVMYLILVPLLVFFFLKDGKILASWFSRFLPTNRGLIRSVWSEVNEKIGAYVRGRVVEMIIVGIATVITFSIIGLQYAVLLGSLVGLAVIVPYIGAIVVTIPILIIGLMQWGLSAHFGYLILSYALIITLDANLLFPLLFSETLDLHPIVIILAVVIFGGIWGFWGVFFAIPLATLVKAILYAWPQAPAPQLNHEQNS